MRISISNRQMRTVDQPVGTCTGREPEQDGRFNRLMAFKRGTGRGRVASARGWTPRVCVRLLDYTGFPRRTQRRAPIFCVSACLCVCVSRQAITLMIIYDRGHTYVSPGRNWFVYSGEGFSRDAEVARRFLLLLYSYTFTSRIFQILLFAFSNRSC